MALSNGKLNRGQIKTGFSHFADMLRNAQSGPLASQQGHTADDLRDAFRQGEEQARRVAEKNGTKESAYQTTYDSMTSLQNDLTSLAKEYNKQIDDIQSSKEPTEAKVAQIVSAINQGRTLANMAAAKWSGNVFDAMQRVLDAEGPGGQSARQFAQAHGLDASQMFRHADDQTNLEDQVKKAVTSGQPPSGATSGFNTPAPNGPGRVPPPATNTPTSYNTPTPTAPGHVTSAGSNSPPRLAPSLNRLHRRRRAHPHQHSQHHR